MAASLFGLGRIEGVDRPAIATVFPTVGENPVLLLDMGANVDCKPANLYQFAVMGGIYAEHVLGISKPKVGLLNIGSEETKGNELTLETYALLKNSSLNFIGNIEGGDILTGKAHVVVCDGFVGNAILKFGESASTTIINFLKQEVMRHPLSILGGLLMRPALKGLRKRVEYESFGGAELLGVNGVCIKAHGRAKAAAIISAIRVAVRAVHEDIVTIMGKQL
jgi:glycerol-3-phosphate acyltransferase PlsX